MVDLRNIPDSPADLDSYEVEHNFHSWTFQPEKSPARAVSAKGTRFTLENGKEMLDFSSCFVSHNIGHQDERVIDAICKQARELSSFAPSMSTKPRALLTKALAEITPGDLSRSFISLGGTEANECAIKIAHQYTGKRKIMGRFRSYHGGTAAPMTMSLGDSRGWKQVLGGLDLVRVPQPYCYRCSFGQQYPGCNMECVKHIDEVMDLEGASDSMAAIIFEPITGANGIIVPPQEYMKELRAVCDKHGVLMIADEVMTGFGRTGSMFAMDHYGVTPDIMSMAKGLTCGYTPMGATIARKHIGDFFKDNFFGHGCTYAGHALNCATALAVLPIYEEDGLVENSRVLGEYLLDQAKGLMEKHPCIGDVRGKGLFVGLELVKNKKTKEPIITPKDRVTKGLNPKTRVAAKLGELGMMAMAANPSNVIAMAPPLIITKSEIDEGIAKMDEALKVADEFCE